MANLLFDLGIIIIAATLLAFIARFLRQPLILGYLIAGIVIGPQVLGLVKSYDTISVLSELGIAFLLFLVGLELDITKLRHFGAVSVLAGTGQVVFTFVVGYFIANALGFSALHSVYIALALTLSSTIMVVKLFSDKGELFTLHGRISLGILLVQDFVAVIALALLSGSASFTKESIAVSLFNGIGLLLIAILVGNFAVGYFFKTVAKNQELLFMSSLAWLFLFIMLSNFLKFSIAIGAFLAGIGLASLPYNLAIEGRIKSLRDFFVTLFFVTLGMQVAFAPLGSMLAAVVILSLFVLILNPVIVMLIMSLLGFKSRTSFLTGISLAQISEFSLVIAAVGLSIGQLSREIVSLVTVIAVVTFTVSSYMITYDSFLLRVFSPWLKLFEKLSKKEVALSFAPKICNYEIILCGCNRIGRSVIETAKSLRKALLVVDFDPEVVRRLARENVPAVYGDIGDNEILEKICIENAKFIISTVPDVKDNETLIRKVREGNKKAVLIVTAEEIEEALRLYQIGADYVIMPHLLGGKHVSVLLHDSMKDLKKLLKHKLAHLSELKGAK